jgi:predicted transcriptional regulator of viral defense system
MDILKDIFNNSVVLTTAKLNEYGISNYMIDRLLSENKISRVSRGNYIYNETHIYDYEIISSSFPEAIIYLESALLLHEYTERIPNEWKIAVGRNMNRNKYNLEYPKIKAHFIDESILDIGVMEIETYLDEENHKNKVITKIYDKDKTICDIIKHRNKIDKEVFNSAIRKYIQDNDKNLNNLYKYARELNVLGLVETYIGVWF